MKTCVIGAIALTLLFAGLATATSSTPSNLPLFLSGVEVSQATYYQPAPVQPGGSFDFYVRVLNPASEGGITPPSVNGVLCQVNAHYPFFPLYPDDDLLQNIGTLQSGQQVQLDFKMRAASDAPQGDDNLFFSCMSANNGWTQAQLPVQVAYGNAVLQITGVQSTPQDIPPGSTSTMVLTLQNQANEQLDDVNVFLDLSSPSLPVSTLGTTGDANLGSIAALGNTSTQFQLIADPDATPGVYKIPVYLTYQDPAGTVYSRNSTISAVVYAPPQVTATLDSTQLAYSGEQVNFTISVTNSGLFDVKRLIASIGQSKGYTLLSPSELYLGDIQSNDFQTANVQVFVNTTNGTIQVPVQVSYLDSFNNLHTQTLTVPVQVYSQAQLYQLGFVQGGSGAYTLLAVAVLLVICYLAYRRYGTSRRKE